MTLFDKCLEADNSLVKIFEIQSMSGKSLVNVTDFKNNSYILMEYLLNRLNMEMASEWNYYKSLPGINKKKGNILNEM